MMTAKSRSLLRRLSRGIATSPTVAAVSPAGRATMLTVVAAVPQARPEVSATVKVTGILPGVREGVAHPLADLAAAVADLPGVG